MANCLLAQQAHLLCSLYLPTDKFALFINLSLAPHKTSSPIGFPLLFFIDLFRTQTNQLRVASQLPAPTQTTNKQCQLQYLSGPPVLTP